MPLHFVFRWRDAMHACVLIDERQILSLSLRKPSFLLPPAFIWAEGIHNMPGGKDNDVFLATSFDTDLWRLGRTTLVAMMESAAYSGPCCPRVPFEVVHPFRSKLSSDSGVMLSTFSAIPE